MRVGDMNETKCCRVRRKASRTGRNQADWALGIGTVESDYLRFDRNRSPTGQAHRLSLSPNASNWSMTSCCTGLNGTTALPKRIGESGASNLTIAILPFGWIVASVALIALSYG